MTGALLNHEGVLSGQLSLSSLPSRTQCWQLEACTLKHPDFIKKSFQTTLRYLLLYAAGLNGIEAKQLATVISNKRQATLKVQFVAGRYFTSFHSDKCEMQRLNWYAVPYKRPIVSETPREVTHSEKVKGDEVHRQ